MVHVALTGNIAAGKSSVAALLAGWGATVIDADQLARAAQAPGTPTLAAIAAAFGPEILGADGALDRARLRAIVLADPAQRRLLEGIVHPAVAARREALVREAAARGDRLVVSDIPLLFEALDPAAFDAVILVDAPEAVRLARLAARPGLSAAEARALVAAQVPAERKRAWRGPRGEGVLLIENDGDRATLASRTRAVWDALQARLPPG
ncbi:MAG: dephospho-CoA kinase [Gemmatimonadetes bacterium]|nr:dephospho-CoA kinase [Gemmatimonadota bacterium]